MKNTKWALAAALGLTALVAPKAALADSTFTVSGTFQDSSTLAGTLTIDLATGAVTMADLTWSDVAGDFTTIVGTSGTAGFAAVGVEDLGGANFIGLAFPVTSLVGYSGGSLCSIAALNCPISGFPHTFLVSDAGPVPSAKIRLTSGSVVATPEPSSLFLLGTGLAGLLGVARRKT